MKVQFIVMGAPEGKGRPRFSRTGHTYTPEKTRAYEDKVRRCWKTQSGRGFAGGMPLKATIVGYFPLPKMSKKKAAELDGTLHTKKCDADNLAKAILDALNGCAYPDDSAVSILHVRKYQTSAAPRVEVTIEEA